MNRILVVTIIVAVVAAAGSSSAGYFSEVDEIIAGNAAGIGARQLAMGGAGVMANNGAALFYNPANLTRVPRIELIGGLSYQKFENTIGTQPQGSGSIISTEGSRNNTRVNTVILTMPYPTYRGSLVFAMGVARSADFDRISSFDYVEGTTTIREEALESGGLNEWAFGFGIDLSPRISFGSALMVYSGKHEFSLYSDKYIGTMLRDRLEQLLDYKYLGLGGRLGLSFQVSPYLALGLAAELPVDLNVEQTGTEIINSEVSYLYPVEYDIRKPFVFSAGLASQWNLLTLTAEMDYTDWTQLKYSDNRLMEAYNNQLRETYREVVRYRFGGEYTFPTLGVTLRGGYFNDPLPYEERFGFSPGDRDGFSFGCGFLIDQVMMLDLAFVRGDYTEDYILEPVDLDLNNDMILNEEIKINRLYLTASYRF